MNSLASLRTRSEAVRRSSRMSWRMIDLIPLILDTNILIETLVNDNSDSARFLEAAESHPFY